MPKWFSLPAGLSRKDATVHLTYYTPATSVDDAVFEARYKDGRTVEVTGQMCWHPAMEAKKNTHGDFDDNSYPYYVYVRTKHGLEVLEHWPMPTFRLVDDSVLVKQAEAATQCNKGSGHIWRYAQKINHETSRRR